MDLWPIIKLFLGVKLPREITLIYVPIVDSELIRPLDDFISPEVEMKKYGSGERMILAGYDEATKTLIIGIEQIS